MTALSDIIDQLESNHRELHSPYYVPGLWVDGQTTQGVEVNPYAFYYQRLSEIAASEPQPLIQGEGLGEWSRNAIVYNLFPRFSTAFDHNDDGRLEIGPCVENWRETGTLLKSIALLPYIRDMGFNTVHLLPIQSIGQDGKKGTLGSPYSIRNPYQLDPNLDEPALNLTCDQLFAGFVEAAHRLGLRVVMEFVLRIAAKDSDWIVEHPDWFYWIRADIPDRTRTTLTGMLNTFGSPYFSSEAMYIIKAKVAAGDFKELPPPPTSYRNMYITPPRPDQVKMENGRYIATLDDGTRARIPGAFADWPPDDHQPPWTDVTYLRMYDHPDFNYMAYNTIRMYDEQLAEVENRNQSLWNTVAGIIPHYQRNFGIDGVLIDMGHALPFELKQLMVWLAREINSDFAFWDENFSISQHSREEGYNAVVGYWLLAAHQASNIKQIVGQMAQHPFPIRFFGAPENHNTPRAMSRQNAYSYVHYALALAITLPVIPFILTGFELCETYPINTGLGFSNEQLHQYPTDRLPLFSVGALNWTRPENIIESIKYALKLRTDYAWLFNDPDPSTFALGYSNNPNIFVYSRRKGDKWISVIANTDQAEEQKGRVVVDARSVQLPGMWGTYGAPMDMYHELMANVSLSPGYVLIIDSSSAPRPR